MSDETGAEATLPDERGAKVTVAEEPEIVDGWGDRVAACVVSAASADNDSVDFKRS